MTGLIEEVLGPIKSVLGLVENDPAVLSGPENMSLHICLMRIMNKITLLLPFYDSDYGQQHHTDHTEVYDGLT